MKQFFKTTFACVLGVLIAGFLGFILLIIGIVSLSTSQAPTYTPAKNSVFKLSLNSTVEERIVMKPLQDAFNMISKENAPIGLDKVLEAIDKATYNDHIVGIYLNTDGYVGSYAISQAIRRKLDEFKATGKFIVAYNSSFTQNQYYLSSVADSVFLNPVGSLQMNGLVSQAMFFKNAMDKLGVEMQIFRVGTFKSAVEPFMRNSMSEANRQQTETFMNSMWGSVLSEISVSRGISADSLNTIANMGTSFASAYAILKTGLVDDLRYQSALEPLLKEMTGKDKVNYASLSDMNAMNSVQKSSKNKIAIYYAAGEIFDNGDEGIVWDKVVTDLDKIKADSTIKAVVLRVNSPGGSAFAAEQIWEAIQRLKKVKPVVTSMSSYAASGGYYISCNSNYIVAEPTTLTGSIGVFGMIPNANELITKKIGITFDEVKTNRFGNITIANPMTDVEKQMVQRSVEDIYALFIGRCAAGRGLPVDSIAQIAEGRVWSGIDAKAIGLVDALGGIEMAIDKAAQLAHVKTFETVGYPREKDFLESLMSELGEETSTQMRVRLLGEDFKHIQVLKYINSLSPIQARMNEMVVK